MTNINIAMSCQYFCSLLGMDWDIRFSVSFTKFRHNSSWDILYANLCNRNHDWAISRRHYIDVRMSAMASQITSLPIVYSTVYSSADQRKHQSSASLAFVRRIHRWPVNFPHKGPVTRKLFLFDDVIMVFLAMQENRRPLALWRNCEELLQLLALSQCCGIIQNMIISYVSQYDGVIKWKHFPRYWPFVRGIPLTKASNAEFWCFLKRSSKQSWGWWFETTSRPTWCHFNQNSFSRTWVNSRYPCLEWPLVHWGISNYRNACFQNIRVGDAMMPS